MVATSETRRLSNSNRKSFASWRDLLPDGINFRFLFHADTCTLLCLKSGVNDLWTNAVSPEYRVGAVFSKLVNGLQPTD